MTQDIYFGHPDPKQWERILSPHRHDRVFVLTDTHTHRHCLPLLRREVGAVELHEITVAAGEQHKTTDSLVHVWTALTQGGATRGSLLINLGGGMVTDLGGFAASTFKRGIAFVNVPTTLLGMVDAAVGGKTGIDLGELKNQVGTFASARAVVIDTRFLCTLDRTNLLSGYAEMLKHGLIDSTSHRAELLQVDPEDLSHSGLARLQTVVERSVQVKQRIVEADPTEGGWRKVLNLGHTAGHAFEALALAEGRAVAHGYAVAWGLVCELYLSHIKIQFPAYELRQTIDFVRQRYGYFPIDCSQYEALYLYMTHDKKNSSAQTVNFTLLSHVGTPHIDQTATREEVYAILDFYRECMGC